MKLSKYIEELNLLLEKHGDLQCYYAKDDEGNGFNELINDGTVMYKGKDDNTVQYIDLYNIDEDEEELEMLFDLDDDENVYDLLEKVVCVN
jgi:hypothetical protein